MSEKYPFHTKEVVIAVVLIVAAAGVAGGFGFVSAKFASVELTDVLSIVASMFVIAVFMERSVDAILTPIRAPDQDRIEQTIFELKSKIAEKLADEAETKKALIEREKELMDYNRNTNQRFYWLSLAFGLVLSVVGVRTLSGLVDPDTFLELEKVQIVLFQSVDIILTGGIISGGSAAIDKLGQRFTSFYNARTPG